MSTTRKVYYSILGIIVLYLVAPFYSIDERLEPYLERYRFIAQSTCQEDFLFLPWRFSLNFGEVDDKKYVARTSKITNNLYTKVIIVVDEKHFNKLNEDERVSLIFHELTHYFYDHPDINDPDHFMDDDKQYTGTKFDVYKQFKDIVEAQCLK